MFAGGRSWVLTNTTKWPFGSVRDLTGQGVFHWNFTTVEGGGTHVVSGGNAQAKTFQHFIGGGRDCYIHGSTLVPVGKWMCVEFHVPK